MKRRESVEVIVGNISLGEDNPIRIQSMTNTSTQDVETTVNQVIALVNAGSELVRLTVNTKEAASAVPYIVDSLRTKGINTPIIGDFHYNGHILLTEFPDCANALDKYRINPGNVGVGNKRGYNFLKIIEVAGANNKAIRIGVNWGSLDQELLAEMMDKNAKQKEPKDVENITIEALAESALRGAALARAAGLPGNKIILSAKVSGVNELVKVYDILAEKCQYPLHLGLTEAGMGIKGIVSSTLALGILLHKGIGDTIRVSITPAPGGARTEEVFIAKQILQSLGVRSFMPQVTACPGCGRTSSILFQEMANEIQNYLQKKTASWSQKFKGVEELKIAVMGCVVNGPGESKHADIGISLPGNGENPNAPVYLDGSLYKTLRGQELVTEFIRILEDYVSRRFTSLK